MAKIREMLMRGVFFLAALASILAVILICVFLFANGIPAIGEIGVFKFLLGTQWRPSNDIYGILPMILGCDSGSGHNRSTDRDTNGCIYGKVL